MPFLMKAYCFRQVCSFLLVLIWAGTPVQGQVEMSSGEERRLAELVEQSAVFAEGHTGFVLYDVEKRTQLYGYNADRLFVPASNIKLVTYWVTNRILGNQAPAVFYQNFTDHYELWGTGYPLTLHPQFLTDDLLTPWLRQAGKPITFNYPPSEKALPRYGAGWSWDDYNGGYVFERSPFPLFGNRLYIENQEVEGTGERSVFSSPPNIINQLRQVPDQEQRTIRPEFGNEFTVRPGYLYRSTPLQRSLRFSPYYLVSELMVAAPEVQAEVAFKDYPPVSDLQSFEVTLPDTVYRRFLQQSDNYLAEQLLLMAAAKRYGKPYEEPLLDYAKDTLLPTIGVENVKLADGSGLSRYSLLTPRHLARVLLALEQEVGLEKLRTLLPEGGTSGTLKRRFDGASEPYVWAKTGTLSGVTCVSGYLKTERGEWLAFSFMHNNFVQRSGNYYTEMEKILGWVYETL